MRHIVREWLNVKLNRGSKKSIDMKKLLTNELATSFLLIWPILEQSCFGGYFQKSHINSFIVDNIDNLAICDYEEAAKHFHQRYQDKVKLENLKHNDHCPNVDAILASKYRDINAMQKLTLLLYVIYRYRNNIFHGNKGIDSWCSYTKEIELCLKSMISIIDAIDNQ